MPSPARVDVHPRADLGRSEDASPVRWFAVAVLVLSTGAFFAVAADTPGSESRPTVLLLWALAYLVAAAILVDGRLRLRLPLVVPMELVLFVGLAALSVAWSVAPDVTLRRAVGLLGTVLVGLVVAQRLTTVEVLDAVRRAVLIVTLASLVLYVSGSVAALDEVHGTLRGVLATKNTLGRVLALGLLAAAATGLLDPSKARRCVLSAVPMVLALALTDSTGGILIAAVVLLGTLLVLVLRRRSGTVAVAGAVALMLGLTVLVAPSLSAERVASAIGEDTTLTGRDEVWAESLDAAAERPVLGYGYGAFWDSAVEADRIRARLQWPVPHAHNGLLDAGLDLGAVGVLGSLVVLGGLVLRGVQDLRRRLPAQATLRLSVAWLVLFSNIAESSLLQQNSLLTLLLVVALAARGPDPATRPPDRVQHPQRSAVRHSPAAAVT